MTRLTYNGVNNIATMFDALNDRRIAMAFLRRELKDLARIVGLDPEQVRRKNEMEIVASIRETLAGFVEDDGELVGPQPCDCAGRGRRWEKADALEDVLVYINPAVDVVYGGAASIIEERFAFVSSQTARLGFAVVNDPRRADIVVDAQEIDGEGSTLGFTQYYNDGTEDLDVFGDLQASVMIVMDPAERWEAGFLRTVATHEIMHAVGIGHIEAPGNLMNAYYGGVKLDLGAEETAELRNLYGKPADLLAVEAERDAEAALASLHQEVEPKTPVEPESIEAEAAPVTTDEVDSSRTSVA